MRVFIAIPAFEPLKGTFVQTLKKLKINADQKDVDVKWSSFENYHATLVFLGERSPEEIEKVKAVMIEVARQHPAFDVKIQNIDGFDDIYHARVLWLGMQNKNNLQKLRADLWSELNSQNFQLPEEDFVPHITIGRLRNPKSCKDLVSPFVRKSFGIVHVSSLVLFESTLQSYFPVYKAIFEVPLQDDV